MFSVTELNIESIMKQFFDQLATEIKGRLPKASGRTADEVEVRMTTTSSRIKAELLAPQHIGALEHGRGPTKKKSGNGQLTLQQAILGWIYERGFTFPLAALSANRKPIKTADQLSWAIAISIHRNGTKLFQQGGHSGVLSTVITQGRVDNFVNVFESKASRAVLESILKNIKLPNS